MKTTIKGITAVNQQGSKHYKIGDNVNGLIIDRIVDNSIDIFEKSFDSIYVGFTSCNCLVFEIRNIPVDVEFVKAVNDE
jgi:hypothetical protein